MPGTFFGISVAQSSLAAQRRAMDVLGYNIANANDPTYKRQRVVLVENSVLAQSQEASSLGTSPFGSGVGAGDIERIKDSLVENRLRTSTETSADWAYRSKTMTQLETVIGEPSDTGLQTDLDNFWNSWQKVAASPESLPIRTALIEDTSALCERIQSVNGQMSDMKDDLNTAIVDKVNRVNLIGEEVARLNNQIGSLESGQTPVNDLQNRRDALVLELSKLVDINQHGEGVDNYIITIGGRTLVQGDKFNSLTTTINNSGNRDIEWTDDGAAVKIKSGELSAALDLRDNIIPGYIAQLDEIAVKLVETVNTVHSSGYTTDGSQAGNFFTPNDPVGSISSANISVDASLIDHPELIGAAGLGGATGDGSVAQNIASVKDQIVASGLSINQLYRAMISDIGSTAATAERQATSSQLSTTQFLTQQQSVSGVNLDEEMTNMIKFQQAYNAASRVLTVMNEMLDTLMRAGG